MNTISKLWSIAVGLLGLAFHSGAAAEPPLDAIKGRDNLVVVVRESMGSEKKDELLTPTGKMKARLPDGREVEMQMAWWEFIGDTHIRFLFDGPKTMLSAAPGDLTALGLTSVDDALAVAMQNVKRTYGAPSSKPWRDGIMEVVGKSPDFDSSYFLDRVFWSKLNKENPDGIVVAVPKRGGLLYAPVSDAKAVEAMQRGVSQLHATSGTMRVSSALFLFKDDKWSVFQAPARR